MTACLDCGRPGQKASRCPVCQEIRDDAHGAAYDAEYAREAKRIRDNAGLTCPRCGRRYTRDNPPTAGHSVAVRRGGSTADGLEEQCRRCNYGWKRTGL